MLSLPAESAREAAQRGAHGNIRHEGVRHIWFNRFGSVEQVLAQSFADSVFDAIEDGLVPGAAPPLDEGGCKELAVAVDADANGSITVGEVRAAFPKGLTFPQCVAALLAKDGTLSMPLPPAVFLGRDGHLDAAMAAWRGRSAAGALVVVAPGGVGKTAFAVGPGRQCSQCPSTHLKPSFHTFIVALLMF